MKNKDKLKNFYRKILYLAILVYVLYVFIGQQKALNSYKKSQEYYAKQLSTQMAYQEDLNKTKASLDSKEYIEKGAREKLDMYLPNERVYIDKGN